MLINKKWESFLRVISTGREISHYVLFKRFPVAPLCRNDNFIVSTAISLLKKYKNRIISVKITNFVLMQPVPAQPVLGEPV